MIPGHMQLFKTLNLNREPTIRFSVNMKRYVVLAFVLVLAVINGQKIIYFDKAKSLKRDPEKGIFYALFKSHRHRRLDVSPLLTTTSSSRQECGQHCAEMTTCFSLNLASVADVHNKLTCELLSTDIYNRSDRFRDHANFHHFSIKTPCSGKPCENGGSCVAHYEKDNYRCLCVPGYEGINCEKDINECASSPCTNGGSCSDLVNRFLCSCPQGYGGVYCEAVHGGYSSWGLWGSCTVTCGGGTRSRSRTCNNPPPQNNGNNCLVLGPSDQSEVCSDNVNCPIHGGYSSWGLWGSCTVTCGGGTRSRSRTCSNPPPQYNGNNCLVLGPSDQSEVCSDKVNCPIDGGYSSWGAWGSCTVTCGGGTRYRSRTCTNPPPLYGGKDCSGLGLSSESENCNTANCCQKTCNVIESSRRDCGYPGISVSKCIDDRGCCYDSNVSDGTPHCYYSGCT